jgi:hypothetical protein
MNARRLARLKENCSLPPPLQVLPLFTLTFLPLMASSSTSSTGSSLYFLPPPLYIVGNGNGDCGGNDEDSDSGDNGDNDNDDNNEDNGNLENLAQVKLQRNHHCHGHSQQAGLKYPVRHCWHWLGWPQEQLVQQWHHSWLHSLWNQCLRRLHHLGFWEAARVVRTSLPSPLKICGRQNLRGYQELVSATQRWREATNVIELFKFILINWRESLGEVLYQDNYLSQIVISAGLLTDLLSVNLSIC